MQTQSSSQSVAEQSESDCDLRELEELRAKLAKSAHQLGKTDKSGPTAASLPNTAATATSSSSPPVAFAASSSSSSSDEEEMPQAQKRRKSPEQDSSLGSENVDFQRQNQTVTQGVIAESDCDLRESISPPPPQPPSVDEMRKIMRRSTKKFYCSKCRLTMNSSSAFETHECIKSELACDQCAQFNCTSKKGLAVHKSMVHMSNEHFPDEPTTHRYNIYSYLYKGEPLKFPDENPCLQPCKKRTRKCKQCSYTADNPRSHLEHMRDVHHHKIYIKECTVCTFVSRTISKIRRHMKECHKEANGPKNQTKGQEEEEYGRDAK